MPADTIWLNWQQACKLLSCSKSHFYNLVKSGKLPSKRSGTARGVTVSKEDCENWADNWQGRLEEK